MRSFPRLFALLLTVAAFNIFASAQKKDAPAEPVGTKVVSAGVLNGRATYLPRPALPSDLTRDKAHGTVTVQVVVGVDGLVETARVVSGHPSLKQAAEQAALRTTFPPFRVADKPAKFSGVLTFDFDQAETAEDLKVALFAVTLTMAKHLAATDAEILKDIFDGENLFEGWTDPDYAKELESLASFETMTVEKRREAIDAALASIEAKTKGSGKWQFAVGRELGDVFGELLLLTAKADKPELETLNKLTLKPRLKNLQDLAASAPADMPADFVAKLKELAETGKSEFTTIDDYKPLVDAIDNLMKSLDRK